MRDTLSRFLSRVDISGDCWEWKGALKPNGYGRFYFPGSIEIYAHRASWEIAVGEIPDGMCVCHRCDNRKCVRPTHLFIATQRDNLLNAKAKGRNAKGEKHGSSKLKETQVREIRKLCGIGKQQKWIAGYFYVSETTVSLIRRRKIWKHI